MLEAKSRRWAMTFKHTTEKYVEKSCYSALYFLQPVFCYIQVQKYDTALNETEIITSEK